MSKPRSRTVRMTDRCKVRLVRSADGAVVRHHFIGPPPVGVLETRWFTPGQLRRLAKAYLEMAGDE